MHSDAFAPPTEVIPAEERGLPWPPRHRWLKRGLIALWIPVGLTVVTHFLWLQVERSRLAAAEGSLRSRGVPVSASEINSAGAPGPSSSTSNTLALAAASIHYTAAEDQWMNSIRSEIDPSQSDKAMVHEITVANARALEIVRITRDQQVQQSIRINGLSNSYNLFRKLGVFLSYVAMDAAYQGDIAEAANRLHDLLRLADAIDAEPTAMVSHLVAGVLRGIACSSTAELAPWMIPSNPDREALQKLIAALLDESPQRAAAHRGWQHARAEMLDWLRDPTPRANSPLAAVSVQLLLRPLAIHQGLKTLPSYDALEKASRMPTLQAAKLYFTAGVTFEDSPRLMEPESAMSPSFPSGAPVVSEFVIRTNRRAAAIILAFQLYRADHGGRLPLQLVALTPTYLSNIPGDPFAPDGRPFSYLPHRSPPAIYSFGLNQIDDGGTSGPNYWTQELDGVFPVPPGGASPQTQQ